MVVCVRCFSDFAVLRDEDEDGYYGYTLDDLYLLKLRDFVSRHYIISITVI